MFHCSVERFTCLAGAAFLAGTLACAQAAELGEASVRSHTGQPLVADIELTALADDAKLQVALASADVYRVAGVRMHPSLAGLNISLNRRDGHRNLHLVSAKPIDADYVHLFFELTEGNRQTVRAATLWLTPDPEPAPAALAAPLPAPLPAQVPARPPMRTPAAPPLLAPAVVSVPAAPPLRPARSVTPPAVCAPQFSAEQIRSCTVLDSKNAALRAQISELEGKVKVLQLAMQGKAEQAVPLSAAKHAPAPVVQPKAVALPAKNSAKKTAGATPWLLIGCAGALMFALIGLIVYIVRRKRKLLRIKAKPKMTVPAKPDSSIKSRLMPGNKEAPAVRTADAAAAS